MCPYVGGSLVSLFDRDQQERTRIAARRMAHRAGDRMTELTVMNTPIDSGNLRTSWYQIPTTRVRHLLGPAYQSGVASDVEYAPHVEYGTGLWGPKHAYYEIKPKDPNGVLVFQGRAMIQGPHFSTTTNSFKPGQAALDSMGSPKLTGVVFTRRVMHPGSPGQHMVQIAASAVEAEFKSEVLVSAELREWAEGVEGGAD